MHFVTLQKQSHYWHGYQEFYVTYGFLMLPIMMTCFKNGSLEGGSESYDPTKTASSEISHTIEDNIEVVTFGSSSLPVPTSPVLEPFAATFRKIFSLKMFPLESEQCTPPESKRPTFTY